MDTRSVGAKAAEGSSKTTTEEVFQVKKIGSEESPAWVFESRGERTILEGTLAQALLGALNVAKTPCKISAEFTVRGEDVQITWGKMGLVENINRNKLAVIERAIALRYIKPLVETSPLCEGRGNYG